MNQEQCQKVAHDINKITLPGNAVVYNKSIEISSLEEQIISKAKELAHEIQGIRFYNDIPNRKYKVEIKDVFMIPFGEYAVKVNDLNDQKILLMENDYLYYRCPKFHRDPLMWIAYKIIKRRFYKR
jgi:hypothetical protein